MKKILSLALAAVMALSLVACGGNNNETTAPRPLLPLWRLLHPLPRLPLPSWRPSLP